MREIQKLIVHCTDSPDDLDIGFQEINQWHKERGWLSDSGISCGYHYIIRRDGKIERGRPDEEPGAHCYGQNRESIGIVWSGRNEATEKQLSSLYQLLLILMHKYALSTDNIHGHNEFSKKTCPNLDMDWVRAEVVFKKINNIDDLIWSIVNEMVERPKK